LPLEAGFFHAIIGRHGSTMMVDNAGLAANDAETCRKKEAGN